MAKKKPQPKATQKFPPFPPMEAVAGDWEGQDVFPSWAGFQERGGPYTSQNSDEPSTGRASVNVHCPYESGKTHPPSPEQVKAYQYLKDHEAEVTQAICKAILKRYPGWREDYGYEGDDTGEDDDAYMPPVKTIDDLRNLIGLGIVHVMDVAKAGHAYVGFELGCTWDEEHGCGVMTHKSRVIEAAQADTAFDQYACEDDGGKPISAGDADEDGD